MTFVQRLDEKPLPITKLEGKLQVLIMTFVQRLDEKLLPITKLEEKLQVIQVPYSS